MYIDEIVMFSKSLKNYISQLKNIFDKLKANNISIKFKKLFIEYFFVSFLYQRFHFFRLNCKQAKIESNR